MKFFNIMKTKGVDMKLIWGYQI